jgi:putative pyrroloquinoline-quinone binding quinoprotein
MRRLVGLLVVPAVLVAACSGTAPGRPAASSHSPTASTKAATGSGARTATSSRLVDWTTYHASSTRSGHVSQGPHGALQRQWTRDLTGAVYGEPLVLASTLVVATERNRVYGLDARTGARRWVVHLGTAQPLSGLPCGDIDPLGITGTPAYASGVNLVFVVAETSGGRHTLWALRPGTGARVWHRNLDTQADRDRSAEQNRAAATVVHGRVITTFGGLAGDCGDYVGYVTSVRTDGQGQVDSYAVPTAREAGMWATPGAVEAPNGNLYVASGNGAELHGRWDSSDSVIELTPRGLHRLSVFAPPSWRDDNISDLDLGSMAPAVVPAADRMVIAGKRGMVYLLRPPLGGVGSQVRRLGGCAAYGGAAVVGHTVLLPCKGQDAIRALHVEASSLRWDWTRSGLYGSPVVAGDHVYVADERSGDLVVLGLAHGHVLGRHHAGPMPHFPSQVVSGDWVFVPTLSGITAFRGS